MRYRIFTEGDCDSNFVKAFMRHIFGNDYSHLNLDYQTIGSYSNLGNKKNLFKEITDDGGRNILIADADYIDTGGGVAARTAYLLTQKAIHGIEFELFLLPTNNDEGNFETLLELIIPDDNQSIIDCFEGYEGCIQQLASNNPALQYHFPNKKGKIYAYVETLTDSNAFEKARKANDLFYSNPNYWNLNSDNIHQLRGFLTAQIVVEN